MGENAGSAVALSQFQCQDVALRFYRHLDERRYGEMAALMHPDGIWSRQGTDIDRSGLSAALTKGRSASLMTHHLLTNLVVTQAGSESMAAVGYLVVFRHDDGDAPRIPVPLSGASGISDWKCEFRPTADGWRIFRLQSRPTFKAVEVSPAR